MKKNLRDWPLFKILPRGSLNPSFRIGFIQSKVTIFWSLVGGIWFFSFFLIKNEGMSLEWKYKIEVTKKYLSFFSQSIILSSSVLHSVCHFIIMISFNHSYVIISYLCHSIDTGLFWLVLYGTRACQIRLGVVPYNNSQNNPVLNIVWLFS